MTLVKTAAPQDANKPQAQGGKFSLVQVPLFEKHMKKLPANLQAQADALIAQIKDDPFGVGGKLVNMPQDVYSAKFGDYRVVYHTETRGRTVTLVLVEHRDKVYESLRRYGEATQRFASAMRRG